MTQTSFSNIMGDVFLILSGIDYANPVRSFAALLGLSTHLFFGLRGQTTSVFGIPTPKFVMSIVIICGLLNILSGSNLMGFEVGPRYTEVTSGFFISLGAFCVVIHRSKTARWLFMGATFSSLLIGGETFLRDGFADWFIIASALCFLVSNYVTGHIDYKKYDQDL